MTLNPGVASLCQITMIKVSASLWQQPDLLSLMKTNFEGLYHQRVESQDILFHQMLMKISTIALPSALQRQLEFVAVELGLALFDWIKKIVDQLRRSSGLDFVLAQELLEHVHWDDFGRIDVVQSFRSAYHTRRFDQKLAFLAELHRLCVEDCIDDCWHRVISKSSQQYQSLLDSTQSCESYVNYWSFKRTGRSALGSEYSEQEKCSLERDMMTRCIEDRNYVAMAYFLKKTRDIIFSLPEFQRHYLHRAFYLRAFNDDYVDVHHCIYRCLFLDQVPDVTVWDFSDEKTKKTLDYINLSTALHWAWHHQFSSTIDAVFKSLDPKLYFSFLDRWNMVLRRRYDILGRRTTHWDVFFALWNSRPRDFKVSHTSDVGLYILGPLVSRGEIELAAEVINDDAFTNCRVELIDHTRFHWFEQIREGNVDLFVEFMRAFSLSDDEETEFRTKLPFLYKYL